MKLSSLFDVNCLKSQDLESAIKFARRMLSRSEAAAADVGASK